jgi:hypothetical protein
VVVFHDIRRSADVESLRENYVEYGRRLEALLRDLTSSRA